MEILNERMLTHVHVLFHDGDKGTWLLNNLHGEKERFRAVIEKHHKPVQFFIWGYTKYPYTWPTRNAGGQPIPERLELQTQIPVMTREKAIEVLACKCVDWKIQALTRQSITPARFFAEELLDAIEPYIIAREDDCY